MPVCGVPLLSKTSLTHSDAYQSVLTERQGRLTSGALFIGSTYAASEPCVVWENKKAQNWDFKDRGSREGGIPPLPCCFSDTAYGQTNLRAKSHKVIITDKTNSPNDHPIWPGTRLPEDSCCSNKECVDRTAANTRMGFFNQQRCHRGAVQGVCELITDRQWIPSEKRTSNNRKQVALTQFWPMLLKVCWRTSLERADPGPESPLAELLVCLLRLARGQPAPAPQN